ncbi:MAG TPA: hypothetical protein VMT35_11800 [Ignavibacteriaceae bacterium]|nr:hypothetical protein [Ignavibacteriaceae bacterium]
MKRRKTYILQIENDDPKKELEFEVEFYLSLTEKQRYKIMMSLLKQTIKALKKNDYQKSPAIISRT